MLTLHKYEGKNINTQFNKEENYVKEYEIEQGIFKTKKQVIEVISKEEIKSEIKNYINNIGKYMKVDINTEIYFEENLIKINLISEKSNILIGKEGKNLQAFQLLIRQFLRELSKFDIKIVLDINNYNEKHLKRIENQVKKICEEVLKTKIEVKLDPMNSFERRKVHSIVSEYDGLQSTSVGTEPARYTIIKIKD